MVGTGQLARNGSSLNKMQWTLARHPEILIPQQESVRFQFSSSQLVMETVQTLHVFWTTRTHACGIVGRVGTSSIPGWRGKGRVGIISRARTHEAGKCDQARDSAKRNHGRLADLGLSVSVTPELLSVQFGGKCKCDKTLLKYEIVKSNHSHSAARH